MAGCHVMSPKYLENQIDVSRENLGLQTLDIYYLHNPETQASTVAREEFDRRIRAAFAALEKAVAEGKIRIYGTATWNAFRVGQESREALSLPELLRLAEEVGGKDHHFRAIQLPYNLAMPEALSARTQRVDGKGVPVLQVARKGCPKGHPVCALHARHRQRAGGNEPAGAPPRESPHGANAAAQPGAVPRYFQPMTQREKGRKAKLEMGNGKSETGNRKLENRP